MITKVLPQSLSPSWNRISRPAAQPVVQAALVATAEGVDRLQALPASEPDGTVADRFREAFFRDYQERMCGQNIRRFLTQFPDPDKLQGAKVLGIENKGFSYFGLVRAMNTRDTNFQGELRVTDKNWYHHVVLEKDGRIFDFDYGITPQTPTVEEYFDTMFLQCDKVRPHEKLKDYQVQVIDAQEYATATRDTSTRMSFRDYLEGWGVNLERYPAPVGRPVG
jgi:hypothetical protein